jgi:hypothetical protein
MFSVYVFFLFSLFLNTIAEVWLTAELAGALSDRTRGQGLFQLSDLWQALHV